MNLVEMVKKLGVGAKLRRAVMRERGWSEADWYVNWPTFSLELERAIREAKL